MAIGLPTIPQLAAVPGIKLGAVNAGISKADKDDLVLMTCPSSTAAAAVFTKNRFCAASVTVARRHLQTCSPQALVVNSGIANAGTGEQGVKDAQKTCELVAAELGLERETVLPFSTGVIGSRLPEPS